MLGGIGRSVVMLVLCQKCTGHCRKDKKEHYVSHRNPSGDERKGVREDRGGQLHLETKGTAHATCAYSPGRRRGAWVVQVDTSVSRLDVHDRAVHRGDAAGKDHRLADAPDVPHLREVGVVVDVYQPERRVAVV